MKFVLSIKQKRLHAADDDKNREVLILPVFRLFWVPFASAHCPDPGARLGGGTPQELPWADCEGPPIEDGGPFKNITCETVHKEKRAQRRWWLVTMTTACVIKFGVSNTPLPQNSAMFSHRRKCSPSFPPQDWFLCWVKLDPEAPDGAGFWNF